jgi:YidC/Oxa1 family membrane protein insertase
MSGMMSIYMPLLLGWFALTFPSGLAVYFITSNMLGIIQYAMQGKANWRNLIPKLPGSTQPATKKSK